MKFWVAIRIAGWVSTVGGYGYAVIGIIYRAAYYYAQTSVAGRNEYVTTGCVGDCKQPIAVSQALVFGITIPLSLALLGAMYGIYKYMQPELNRITELKAQ
jgi:hypothetical protein